jgi:hypothetical protein
MVNNKNLAALRRQSSFSAAQARYFRAALMKERQTLKAWQSDAQMSDNSASSPFALPIIIQE